MQAGLKSLVWEPNSQVGGCLCAHTLSCIEEKEWEPLSHRRARAKEPVTGLACLAPVPLFTGNLGEKGAPWTLSLLSTCQWRTSVLPSSGGEQPVTVGSLWIQQAAFVSSQLWHAAKSNRVGRWLVPGKGATSLERKRVGRGNGIYAPGPMPTMCFVWDAHMTRLQQAPQNTCPHTRQ